MARERAKLVVRVLPFFHMESFGLKRLTPLNFELSGPKIEAMANQSDQYTLSVVTKFATPRRFVICSPNSINKPVNEPWIEGLFYRFVRKHSSRFWVIFRPTINEVEILFPYFWAGNLGWNRSFSWDLLKDLDVRKKRNCLRP